MARLPKPLSTRGGHAQRWGAWRARQRAAVMSRCSGVCEALDCPQTAVEAHHVFGRRHIIGEPLASHRVMVTGLCLDCHRKVTAEPTAPLTVWLQNMAIVRAVDHFGLWDRYGELPIPRDDIGVARAIEQALHDNGHLDELRREAGVG